MLPGDNQAVILDHCGDLLQYVCMFTIFESCLHHLCSCYTLLAFDLVFVLWFLDVMMMRDSRGQRLEADVVAQTPSLGTIKRDEALYSRTHVSYYIHAK